jgi:hypothetical protein
MSSVTAGSRRCISVVEMEVKQAIRKAQDI